MSSFALAQSTRRLQPEHLRGLLVHIDAEEVSLRNAMRLLQDIPLFAADEILQRELRVRIEQALQHVALLSQNRNKVTSALGQFLGIPQDQICFSALLPFATPAAASLLVPARLRLQRLAHQVRTLTNSVAWIINESWRIHLAVFDSLPGASSSDRYDSSGQRHLNPASFRFETRS